jgi:hypothetical protein
LDDKRKSSLACQLDHYRWELQTACVERGGLDWRTGAMTVAVARVAEAA